VDAPFVIIFLVLMGFIGHPILCVVPLFFFMVSLIIGVWSRKRLEVLTNQASALSNFKTGILVESIEGA
jgi:ATP-binding cassette subfamily C protein LapB